jgi:hypothetical protein
MKTASVGSKKYYPYMIFSFTFTFRHIHIKNIPVLSRMGV